MRRAGPFALLFLGIPMLLGAMAAYVWMPAVWWNGLRVERGMNPMQIFEIMKGRWTRIVTKENEPQFEGWITATSPREVEAFGGCKFAAEVDSLDCVYVSFERGNVRDVRFGLD